MRKIFLIVLLLFSVAFFGQAPDKFFSKYGGDGIDIGYGLKETYDRQYIIVGSTTSYGLGAADAYLMLIDSMGQLKWQKTFGGALVDIGKNVIVNPSDSGFVFAGFTSSFGAGGYDIYVVRTDKNGNLIWQKSYGGIDWDFANDIILSNDLNIIVCGNTSSYGYGKTDGYLMKIDINTGTALWQKNYGGTEDDDFKAIKLASDGKYILAGNSNSFGDLNGDFWFFKAGFIGDSIISKKISSTNKKEICYDLTEDNEYNLIFCGSKDTSYNNIGKNISYLIKTDLIGNFVSEFQNPGALLDDDKFTAITASKFGVSYCMSRKVNNGFFATDVQPFHTDKAYNYLSSTTYGGNQDEDGNKIIFTSDNGYAIVGSTKSYGSVSEDVFFIKMDFSIQNASNIVGYQENISFLVTKKVHMYNNIFYLNNSENKILNCYLYNVEGKLIESGKTNSTEYILQKDIPSGIYLFKADDQKEYQTLKFIKQ